jgi:phospholipase/lecithinase/hemolysin
MESTPETIREAQRALAQYMETERRRQHRRDALGDAGAAFSVEDGSQHAHKAPAQRDGSPEQRASDYAKTRNQNLRPLRQIDESDENARDGRDSALAYLERRRRSVIRK